MSHQSVRFLLRDVSNSLADNIEFWGGREEEFNNLKSKATKYRWLLPLNANRSPYNNQTRIKTWNVAIRFMQKDDFDANAEKTNYLHDDVDIQVDQFLQRLDDWSQTSNDIVGDVTIQSVTQQPFYKKTADIYSGWELRFQLVTSDDFEYCTPENLEYYAGNI